MFRRFTLTKETLAAFSFLSRRIVFAVILMNILLMIFSWIGDRDRDAGPAAVGGNRGKIILNIAKLRTN